MKKYLSIVCLTAMWGLAPLSAEQIVQCIANFPCNAEALTQALHKKGLPFSVVATDIKEYESQLLKKKGKLEWVREKFFPKSITLADNIEKIVFFNITPKMIKKYHLHRFPKDKISLFMWEPKTVLQQMYSPEIVECFSKVFTWDDSLLDDSQFIKFNYPVFEPMIEDIPTFEEKKLCTLVASNLKSNYPNELYSEREKVIDYFEKIEERGFEFWGRRWDSEKHPSYRGTIIDKVDTIRNYRFSICYENTSDATGYITEKIFDCFMAGTVPVYWGAPNITDHIPKGCFIDRRDFASMEELHHFLKSMSQTEYEGYAQRIAAFLKSDSAQRFNREQFHEAFCQAVL